jgi:hypothetical protein
MGPAERTILGPPALSGSLQPGFSANNTGHGSSTIRTLYFVDICAENSSAESGNWPDGVRTDHSLSYGHRDIFLYQAI